MSSAYSRVDLATVNWPVVLSVYLTKEQLSGHGSSCPVCGGNDRFTFDNRHGKGDWVCRKHDDGKPKGGKGIDLLMELEKVDFRGALDILRGETHAKHLEYVPSSTEIAEEERKRKAREYYERLTSDFWNSGSQIQTGGSVYSYLLARVPGLDVRVVKNLRENHLEYVLKKEKYGSYSAMVARFQDPLGRFATSHRTYLAPSKSAKLELVCRKTGKVAPARHQGASLVNVHGGAVRLLDVVDGHLGVAEGIETALAAFMLFGIPTWSCLNRILLSDFVVPEGLGVRHVHIFADYDEIDMLTGKSPGIVSALELQKRLRATGMKVTFHRPKKIGTDFADEWADRAKQAGRLAVA